MPAGTESRQTPQRPACTFFTRGHPEITAAQTPAIDQGNTVLVTAARMLAVRSYGMRPVEAIRSATLHAAEVLGRDDVGVQAGRWADLVAVPGNSTVSVRLPEQVPLVMKGGEVVDTKTGVRVDFSLSKGTRPLPCAQKEKSTLTPVWVSQRPT